MIKGEYDYLKQLADINECAEHGTPLVVATHPSEALWVLRCGKGHYPDTIRHIPSLTQEYKQGTLGDGPVAENIKKRSRKKAMSNKEANKSLVLGEVPRVDLGTGELLVPEQIQSILHYASKYALDAYRGHVLIMYGKPYISIDGYLYHANKAGVPYNLSSRPLDDEERKSYQIKEGDHAWISDVTLFDPERSFQGIGIVTQDEIKAKSTRHPEQLRSPVVAAHPWQLAQKRAEWQALRRGVPIGASEEVTIDSKDKPPATEVVED